MKVGLTKASIKSALKLSLVLFVLFSFATIAQAEAALDQEQTTRNVYMNIDPYSDWVQTITAGEEGVLTKVELPGMYLNNYLKDEELTAFCTDNVSLKVLEAENGEPTTTVLAKSKPSGLVSLESHNSTTFEFTDAFIESKPGEMFAISLEIHDSDCDFRWPAYQSYFTGIDAYPNGMFWTGNENQYTGYYFLSNDYRDFTFKTYVRSLTPRELLDKLYSSLQEIEGSKGVVQSLESKLKVVEKTLDNDSLDNATAVQKSLDAFISTVEKHESQGDISSTEADKLISLAEKLQSALEDEFSSE